MSGGVEVTHRLGHSTRFLFLGVVAALVVAAAPAAGQVAVVRGARLAATGTAPARQVAAAVARAEACLAAAGVPTRRLEDDRLTPDGLAAYRALVLPLNRIDHADVPTLAAFVARGGGLVVFAPEGAPELLAMLGLAPGERMPLPAPVTGITLKVGASTAPPGLPAWLPLPHRRPRPLVPLDGTRILGRWGTAADGAPAVTWGPAGVAVAEPLMDGELLARGWFLRAILGHWDPALAAGWLPQIRRQMAETLTAAAQEVARRAGRPGGEREQQAALVRQLQQERSRVNALLLPPLPPADDSTATDAALRAGQEAILQLRRLTFRAVPSPPGEMRAVWIHTYAPTDWEAVMRKLREHGFNTIFVRVGRGGNVIYPSAILPRDAWAFQGDELQRALDAARRHGIAFHAWRVNYDLRSAPRDYFERMAKEDRLVRDSTGKQGISANPADPRNAELELRAMLEIVEKYDVDGVHFDYIRYPDEPSFDFDYGPVSRREFEKATGKPVRQWPEEVISGPRKQEYEEWEITQVDRLVERVSRAVKQRKPWVQVSAAVWRNHRRWRSIIKQDWPRWVERGWLDFVVPMNYTAEPETFAEAIAGQVAAAGGRAAVVAGIGSWLLQTPEELLFQVEAARAAGAAGFCLFAYNAEQIDEHLEALRLGATSRAATPAFPVPALRFSLTPALKRADAPLGVAVGKSVTVRLEALGTWRGAGEVRLEAPDGTLIAPLGTVSGAAKGPRSWQVPAPGGVWRPVVRGIVIDPRGQRRNLIATGPVAEGLDPAALAAAKAAPDPR